MTAKETGLRGKVRDGKVVSDKMQKTIVVAIEANFRHRLYKKTVRRVRRFMAHDERDEAKLGDRVRIVEASPISRRKRWRLLEVLTRADLPSAPSATRTWAPAGEKLTALSSRFSNTCVKRSGTASTTSPLSGRVRSNDSPCRARRR